VTFIAYVSVQYFNIGKNLLLVSGFSLYLVFSASVINLLFDEVFSYFVCFCDYCCLHSSAIMLCRVLYSCVQGDMHVM
jgi:hypothetical protein